MSGKFGRGRSCRNLAGEVMLRQIVESGARKRNTIVGLNRDAPFRELLNTSIESTRIG